MSLIPLTVLMFIVTIAFGGPEAFVNSVGNFATEALAYAASWIRNL